MRLRILYVEVNPLVRELTAELLAQHQRELVALSTAEQALDEFEKDPFEASATDSLIADLCAS
ncbi:MAG TPA: hypothetical protein VK437_06760 [Steroidobacteraceae bacterium]|nr:hypothetical protein [Steroidobacteraceae bacterium]